MKTLVVLIFLGLSSCAQSQKKIELPAPDTTTLPNEKQAYFAEGCFWHTELVFQSLYGVKDAVSGYSGGKTQAPTYEQVCSGKTGHAETVRVVYDPSKISYEQLAIAFFESHDPTSLNRQGNDVGTEYRSVAFYSNMEERAILEKLKTHYQKQFKSDIVTGIQPFTTFYRAEEYHQEYIKKNPENGYINSVTMPDYLRFTKKYKGKLKE